MAERRAGRRLVAAAVLAAVLAVGVGPAGASDVSAAQLRDLAARAEQDSSALAQLRQVDRVDGQPVDVGRALAGASGPALQARLRALAEGSQASSDQPADPSARAARILDERRFHRSRVPRPFRGIFRTIGGWLQPVLSPVGRFFSRHFGRQFHNRRTAFAVGLAVILAAVVVSLRLIRRRSSAGVEHAGRRSGGGRPADPEELERRAVEAERAGQLDLALRLRFRAGLLRLDLAGVVHDRPALTTGVLTHEVPSPVLHDLAVAFEEVAYGGRPASPDDLAAARSGWRRVLDEARR
ncbi:MAG TPA: DUF4129 domain-containing protein [Acidimicrobiales bacterium]|nr:DUF4129 domain-containing protein [Acidimicrobiales bacterium]